MNYDLVVKNGTIIDGSGGARYRADVGILDGKIASIGRIDSKKAKTIDAEGHVVTPGFVDGHTHMDAQIFWDPIGSCSCYHGVTSVVMGNCGFTLAPCREAEADMVFRSLERAEDLSRDAMLAGIDWSWETFPEYLDYVSGNYKSKFKPSVVKTDWQQEGYSRKTEPVPSHNSEHSFAPATKKESMQYTGERKLVGIAMMHKSNLVPVFADDDDKTGSKQATEIAQMRRN